MHDNILIGSHEEQELELMLAGTKPLAMFYEVPGHDAFWLFGHHLFSSAELRLSKSLSVEQRGIK